ncbi:MAG: Solitary outer membrane autotransporter beta-barrel domain [Candidatus Thiodiazotropha sp.]
MPAILLAISLTYIEGVFAYTQDEINRIRDVIADSERGSNTGAGYAQLVGFVTDPDVTGITLYGDEEPENRFDIYKFPLLLNNGSIESWDYYFRGGLNYATFESDNILVGLPSSDNLDTKYTAYSGALGLVLKRPISQNWNFAMGLDVGLARFENDSDYKGLIEELAPFVDNLMFNWSTNARLGSLVAGLEYRQDYGNLDLASSVHYIHSYISSFAESGDFVGFKENTDTLHLAADLHQPLGLIGENFPISGIVHLGNITFMGDNRDALGFSSLWSFGYALQLAIDNTDREAQSLKLGLNYLKGDNQYHGYEIVFGFHY